MSAHNTIDDTPTDVFKALAFLYERALEGTPGDNVHITMFQDQGRGDIYIESPHTRIVLERGGNLITVQTHGWVDTDPR